MKAIDADYGNNSIITYTLLPSEYVDKFSIDASFGNITVIGELDRENTSEVILYIQATDGKFPRNTTLVISLEDVNDNAPYFSSSLYSANVTENIPIGSLIVNVTAEDEDCGSNGQVTYSLVRWPNDTSTFVNDTFSVDATSGAVTTLKRMKLNASRAEYKFYVKASDNGSPSLASFASIVVTVEDSNDSPPAFTKCENQTFSKPRISGTRLFSVSASDGDYGLNANITFLLTVELCPDHFVIYPDGAIYSQKPLPWGTHCIINITATDGVHSAVCVIYLRVQNERTTVQGQGERHLLPLYQFNEFKHNSR